MKRYTTIITTLILALLLSSCSRIRNSDNDLLKDYVDQCPRQDEDYDDYRDEDGCNDYDNDSDGIRDSLDQCPNVPEDFDLFQDEDGCPDLDNDYDGIEDQNDSCPDEAEDDNGYQDDDGCPDATNDSDGDSVPDAIDQCWYQIEDFDGFQDEDGCVDEDNDSDSIIDSLDLCPNEPETENGIDDDDGCPEADRDSDGIMDSVDQCPDEAVNNYTRAGQVGCPGPAPIHMHRHPIRTLNFKSGSTHLSEVYYDMLDELISILNDWPEVRVKITGHTDNQGSESANIAISLRRAEVVLTYFTEHGISPDRFQVAGAGSSNPIMSNETEEGKALNRRIEFRRIEE